MFQNAIRGYYQLIYALVFVLIANLSAQAEESLNAHPAMWVLENEHSKVYFLGSVHLLPEDIKWYGGPIKDVVESADEVVFEVHMTPEMEAKARSITLANGLLDKGDLLSNYLEPDDYEFLITKAAELGIPAQSMAGFKPWFASIALSIGAIQKEGWDPQSGVDKYIEKIATSNDVEISDLETIELQMATLYDHPLDVQAGMLKDTLEQLRNIKDITLEMVGAWADGDEDKMSDAFITPMQQQREIYRKLVIQRNNNWVPVIEGLANKSQTTLVVAGVAHFIGKDGVVELLNDKGYQVKRVQ